MSDEQQTVGLNESEPRPIAVVAAMKEELRQIRRRLEGSRKLVIVDCEAYSGRIGSSLVTIASTGDGAISAARGLERLLESQSAKAIIVVGIAGALSPELEIGDVVVCREVRDEAGRVFEMDADLVAQACRFPVARVGSAVSVGRIASSADEKRRLWKEHGSLPSQVVDLESASYAYLAAQRNLPCLITRVVSDGPTETLPVDFNRFLNLDGGVDRSRVLREALRHPTLMPKLLRMRDRLQSGAALLDQVLLGVIGQ